VHPITPRSRPQGATLAAPARTGGRVGSLIAGVGAPVVASFVAFLAAALPAAPAAAQYKVVNPDGGVTYTDRPPVAAANVRITQMGRAGAAPVSTVEPTLPPELQQAVRRYPVALYTTGECATCDRAREFLQRRGIPYRERLAQSADDVQALERLVGSRSVPALTVGPQSLVGYDANQWTEYLDAAGYPRESKLPRGWQAPAPTPLTERPPPVPAAAAPSAGPAATTSPAAPAAEDPTPTDGRLRF
jgi:glutaredoxin